MPDRGNARRLLAVVALLVGLVGMHSLLLADPAAHPPFASTAVAPASPPASTEISIRAGQTAAASPQNGQHVDLVAACVLALLLTLVLLVGVDRRALRRCAAWISPLRLRAGSARVEALRTPPAILAVSRT